MKDPDLMATGECNEMLEDLGLSVYGNIVVLRLNAAGNLKDLHEEDAVLTTHTVICWAADLVKLIDTSVGSLHHEPVSEIVYITYT